MRPRLNEIALHSLARELRRQIPLDEGYSDMWHAFNQLNMTSEDVERDGKGRVDRPYLPTSEEQR